MAEILSSPLEKKASVLDKKQQTSRPSHPTASIQPDWLDNSREGESWNKSHANPVWFKAAPG